MSIEFKTMDELVNIILNDSALRGDALKVISKKAVSMSFDGVVHCGFPTLTRFNIDCRRRSWAQLLLCLKSELQDVWDDRYDKYLSKHNPYGSYPIGYNYFPPVLNTNQQGTTTMNNTTNEVTINEVILSVITNVFGKDISRLDANQLIGTIEQCRNEITRLEGLEIESKYVGKQVRELNKAITLLIKQLDNR